MIHRRGQPYKPIRSGFDRQAYLLVGMAFVLLVAVLAIGGCALEQWKCGQKGEEMHRETKFTVAPRVCYIRLDGGSYIDIEKYRAIN